MQNQSLELGAEALKAGGSRFVKGSLMALGRQFVAGVSISLQTLKTTGAQELQGPDHPPDGQGLQQELVQAAQQPRPLSLVHGRSVATPQTLRSAVRGSEVVFCRK